MHIRYLLMSPVSAHIQISIINRYPVNTITYICIFICKAGLPPTLTPLLLLSIQFLQKYFCIENKGRMVGDGGAMVWLVRVAIEYIMINYALTCERGPALQGAVLTMGTLESGVYKNLGLWSMFWKEETLFLIHGEARCQHCQDCQAIKQLLAVASTRKAPTQLRSWQRDHNNKINMWCRR